MSRRVRLAVTLGDPRGIGPEIAAAVLPAIDSADFVAIGAREQIDSIAGVDGIGVGRWGPAAPGMASPREAGLLAGRSIERAVAEVRAGRVDGLVTAPIEKHAIHLAGYHFPGHTEWLAHLAGGAEVAMMLASSRLRVVLITTHIALRDVPLVLTADRIVRIAEITRQALISQFGIAGPRIAMCALNPHAGEQGLFGDEEQRIMSPAIERAGLIGPLPADTVFVRAMRGEFDAVLAPYHDVGMTAIKVASFGTGVNVTLGLPFVRTSPDHGTALDIAGKGLADPSSMRAATELAIELAARRISR